MMTLVTGIDAVEIQRIGQACHRWGEKFVDRIFTPNEQAHCRNRAESFAGRFAAKEAVSKALGVGIGDIRWRDIEVLPDPRGKPTLHLHGKAAEIAMDKGLIGFDVSITHSRDDAIAIVVAWGSQTC